MQFILRIDKQCTIYLIDNNFLKSASREFELCTNGFTTTSTDKYK